MARPAAVLEDIPTAPKYPLHETSIDDDLEKDAYTSARVAPASHQPRTGFMAPAWKLMDKLESSYGVEARGIERVPEDQRTHAHLVDNMTLWLAANCTISTFALGTLGNSIWFLGFPDAALTIIFFNLIGTLPAAIFATWGKSSGLRQIAFSRFSFGYITVLIPTILNLIACIGWSVINSIAGGQALRAVSATNKIPMTAAIIVIGVVTLIVSFFGYRFVHMYERFIWIPVAITFFILLGKAAPHMDAGTWGGSGEIEAASVLSFGAAIIGFSFGWASLAGDYTVNMPVESSNLKLFVYTYVGLFTPMILLELLGAACMTTFTAKTTWEHAYETESVGGLVGEILRGSMHGFGSFLMLIIALSIVANNIPNIYSFAMTFQVLGPWAQQIPRPFLSIFASVLYVILACVGAHSFEAVLDNLLLFLAYWLSIFVTILIEEHYIFRKGRWANYDFDAVTERKRLPLGLAALGALGAGWAGGVLGMSTSFFVGPIGGSFGLKPFGGDLGFELAMGFTALTYPPLRYLEKRYFKY